MVPSYFEKLVSMQVEKVKRILFYYKGNYRENQLYFLKMRRGKTAFSSWSGKPLCHVLHYDWSGKGALTPSARPTLKAFRVMATRV
jgi:hypothetical protein